MFFKQVLTIAATVLVSCLVLLVVGITGYRAMGSGSQQAQAGGQPPGDAGRSVENLNGDDSVEAVNQAQSMNNLEQIGFSRSMAYQEANGFVPTPAIQDPKSGKPLPELAGRDLAVDRQSRNSTSNSISAKPGTARIISRCSVRCPRVYARAGANVADPMALSIRSSSAPARAFEPLEGGQKLGIAEHYRWSPSGRWLSWKAAGPCPGPSLRILRLIPRDRFPSWADSSKTASTPLSLMPRFGSSAGDGSEGVRATDQGVRHPQRGRGHPGWTNCR